MEILEQIQEVTQPTLQNWNNINIDKDNPIYLLLREFGCDLASEITNKYDAFIIVLQFAFATFIIFMFLKYLFKVVSQFTGGKF